jgi:hypothetical protein
VVAPIIVDPVLKPGQPPIDVRVPTPDPSTLHMVSLTYRVCPPGMDLEARAFWSLDWPTKNGMCTGTQPGVQFDLDWGTGAQSYWTDVSSMIAVPGIEANSIVVSQMTNLPVTLSSDCHMYDRFGRPVGLRFPRGWSHLLAHRSGSKRGSVL